MGFLTPFVSWNVTVFQVCGYSRGYSNSSLEALAATYGHPRDKSYFAFVYWLELWWRWRLPKVVFFSNFFDEPNGFSGSVVSVQDYSDFGFDTFGRNCLEPVI